MHSSSFNGSLQICCVIRESCSLATGRSVGLKCVSLLPRDGSWADGEQNTLRPEVPNGQQVQRGGHCNMIWQCQVHGKP